MYVPSSFREDDPRTLHAFLQRYSFATLISCGASEPFASHLPLLLDEDRGPHGTLLGHMARANPQWRDLAGKKVLAIFHGPHGYVSPAWYQSEDVVPTWNYAVVHAYGTVRLVDDRARLLHLVRLMVERFEGSRELPWSLESQSETFINRMLDGIVGFGIEIDRLEGKWKLSQNHSPERRQRVADALRQSGSPDARQIAEWMEARSRQAE